MMTRAIMSGHELRSAGSTTPTDPRSASLGSHAPQPGPRPTRQRPTASAATATETTTTSRRRRPSTRRPRREGVDHPIACRSRCACGSWLAAGLTRTATGPRRRPRCVVEHPANPRRTRPPVTRDPCSGLPRPILRIGEPHRRECEDRGAPPARARQRRRSFPAAAQRASARALAARAAPAPAAVTRRALARAGPGTDEEVVQGSIPGIGAGTSPPILRADSREYAHRSLATRARFFS